MGHGAIEIRVRDNGPGLTATARQNVFEPFFTTKTKGTGLGMAIARRIVDAHGGQISIGNDSAGAEFIITLKRTNS
jgi:signal transduction histidine kinase